MASVFLNKKKSKYWVACFSVAGRQVQKSSRLTKKAAAQIFAATLEKAAKDAKDGPLTEEYIRDVINFILRLAGRESSECPSIRGWFESWGKNAEVSLAPGTTKRYAGVTKEFLSLLGEKADKTLRALSISDVEKFRSHLIKEGESPASINLALKSLRSCLGRAVAQNLIQHNRALAVDLVERDHDDSWSKRPLTTQEIPLILTAAPNEEWRDLIKCGYYIGDRIGSLVHLRLEYFDLQARELRYIPGKQKRGAALKTIIIPLHPEIVALVQSRGAQSGPLFPTLCRKRVGGKTGLSLTFRAILDRAGITYKSKQSRGGRGRIVHEVGFHALRRSFNSDLANSGVPQEIRQRLIGHASEE